MLTVQCIRPSSAGRAERYRNTDTQHRLSALHDLLTDRPRRRFETGSDRADEPDGRSTSALKCPDPQARLLGATRIDSVYMSHEHERPTSASDKFSHPLSEFAVTSFALLKDANQPGNQPTLGGSTRGRGNVVRKVTIPVSICGELGADTRAEAFRISFVSQVLVLRVPNLRYYTTGTSSLMWLVDQGSCQDAASWKQSASR
jgi:hypothetical protein